MTEEKTCGVPCAYVPTRTEAAKDITSMNTVCQVFPSLCLCFGFGLCCGENHTWYSTVQRFASLKPTKFANNKKVDSQRSSLSWSSAWELCLNRIADRLVLTLGWLWLVCFDSCLRWSWLDDHDRCQWLQRQQTLRYSTKKSYRKNKGNDKNRNYIKH